MLFAPFGHKVYDIFQITFASFFDDIETNIADSMLYQRAFLTRPHV
jgi:hypothetical protein